MLYNLRKNANRGLKSAPNIRILNAFYPGANSHELDKYRGFPYAKIGLHRLFGVVN